MLSDETKENPMVGKEKLIAHLLKDNILEAGEALEYLLLSIGFNPVETKDFVLSIENFYKNRDSTNRWTDNDNQTILVMYEEGLPPKEIAKKLGRTVASVNQRIFNMRRTGYNLPPRRPRMLGNSYSVNKTDQQ